MPSEPIQLKVYFDFLCPFAYRAHLWLADVQAQLGTQLQIDWRYFSLEQVNAPADTEWKLWEQDGDYATPSGRQAQRALQAFWAAEAARRQGQAAFDRFRTVVYHARHRDGGIDLNSRIALRAAAAQAELDLTQFDHDSHDRALLDVLRQHYEEARSTYQVFGVPTLCFDGEHAIYLKLQQVPPSDDSLPLFEELRRSITTRRWLAEIKRPNP